jgi:hypothetical protein
MSFTLAVLLKDSDYKLTQFKPAQIEQLETRIVTKESKGKVTPYITCLVRDNGARKFIAVFVYAMCATDEAAQPTQKEVK